VSVRETRWETRWEIVRETQWERRRLLVYGYGRRTYAEWECHGECEERERDG
jgi:hypothetical protein